MKQETLGLIPLDILFGRNGLVLKQIWKTYMLALSVITRVGPISVLPSVALGIPQFADQVHSGGKDSNGV